MQDLSMLGTGACLAVVIASALLGYVTSAWLGDRLGGVGTSFWLRCAQSSLCSPETPIPVNDAVMLTSGFPLGFFSSGVLSGRGRLLTELFPPQRGSGQGSPTISDAAWRDESAVRRIAQPEARQNEAKVNVLAMT
jgi:MFS family permease